MFSYGQCLYNSTQMYKFMDLCKKNCVIVCILSWRRKCQPTPGFLPGESHGQRSLEGQSPWGCIELDTFERLTLSLPEKNTRPFTYDLNQIPYDQTVEVINRFTGLDLVDRVPEELWTELCYIVQEAVTKTIPKKKKCKKAKWLSQEALQIAEERRELKAREKSKGTPN